LVKLFLVFYVFFEVSVDILKALTAEEG
jgi:hypothetical protein